MSRLKNLYTYLIKNCRGEIDEWHEAYQAMTRDVAAVREELVAGKSLQEIPTYRNTSLKDESDPWKEFAKRLLFDRSNGISSRGQSVLSLENFGHFIAEQDFVNALASLIKEPSRGNFDQFNEAWETARIKHGGNRNPLLINRTLAACRQDVSSTANTEYFDTVYSWLVCEGLLPAHTNANADWFDRNVQLMTFLHDAFADDLREEKTDQHLLSIFVWYLYENIYNPFSLKKQVIKYGAPGTGKTFTARQVTRLQFDIWSDKYNLTYLRPSYEQCSAVVQFHPSFGYEDFIEGLRPTLSQSGQSRLTLHNGIFKEFCRRAGLWEVEVCKIPEKGPELAKNWGYLTVGQLKPYIGHQLKDRSWESIRFLPDSERISDVTPPFFFIIDEINRAELSRVLGELMYCMEYRGVGGAISTQYASLNDATTALIVTTNGAFKFFIPHNVYIIGTMNTIDRSVESFDLALRRRFRWERINPDIAALRYHLKQRDAQPGNASRPWVGLADDLESLNKRIRETDILGGDYEIGHAYLMNLRYSPALTRTELRKKIWDDSIRPLLEEYLRGSGREETLIPEFQKVFGIRE